MMDMYEEDIPERLAIDAHRGTSWTPADRARQERAAYADLLRADHARLDALADTPAKQAVLEEEWQRYRAAFRARKRRQLASRSRCVSWAITGSSNFPTRRAEKHNEIERRRADELEAFRARALAQIRKRLCPELRPIMAGDDNATERLREEIAKAERKQEVMRAANLAIRKHAKAGADAQVMALLAGGLTEKQARGLLVPDWCGRIGFPDYALKNNGANIRRLKGRVGDVETAKATPDRVTEGAGGVRLEDAPADNRVRLYFPHKPTAETREGLKARGFRWTPTLGCWQAYRNSSSLAYALAVTGTGA